MAYWAEEGGGKGGAVTGIKKKEVYELVQLENLPIAVGLV